MFFPGLGRVGHRHHSVLLCLWEGECWLTGLFHPLTPFIQLLFLSTHCPPPLPWEAGWTLGTSGAQRSQPSGNLTEGQPGTSVDVSPQLQARGGGFAGGGFPSLTVTPATPCFS